MIPLNFKNLLPTTVTHLAVVQKDIDAELDFEAKARKAKSKWDGKTGSASALAAFNDIKQMLIQMCSGAQICVYCEHNEATDIEHIYPKRLYPEKAFTWSNYVFACGNCNSRYKGESFSIFDPMGGCIIKDITPLPKVYTQPANDDALFINQRKDDPMELLELDILSRQYIFRERYAQGTREYEKAFYTKELLGLNTRADLIRQRKAAHSWYISELKNYVSVRNTNTIDELVQVTFGEITIDLNAVFTNEKHRVLVLLKEEILSHSHPTVLKELIRQRINLPQTNLLLIEAPEILTW